MKALLTKKIGMMSIITEKGEAIGVTLLAAEPNIVTQKKTTDNDGYEAVQIGGVESKKINKPEAGHLKPAAKLMKYLREIRVDDQPDLNVGDQLDAAVFTVGDSVQVTGTSKGKGFAGTIKRHNFKRGRKTHGGRSYRRPGSIGSMYPQRIFPGKKMAGQMGGVQVTVKNLKVALVDTEHNVIGVTGAVPGPNKSLVMLKGADV